VKKSTRSSAAFAFTALLLLHDPVITLTGSAPLGHALLAIGVVWLCLSLGMRALTSQRLAWAGGLPAFAAVCSLSGMGIFYSLIDRGEFNVKVQFLATFVLVPMIWAALSELAINPKLRAPLCRLLLFYVLTELSIMLLQLSYLLVGIGLPPNDTYESMVPGSQFNGNNLAAIVVLLSIFYNESSKDVLRSERLLFNVVVILILVIILSRLAVLLYFFDQVRRLSFRQAKKMIAIAAVAAAIGVAVVNIESTGNETIDVSLNKAKSFAAIAEVGLETDRSTSSRSQGYINFFDQFASLGVGSMAILDYSTFTASAVFDDEAGYAAPHSMLIEFGYWMGWAGLLTLGTFMLVAFGRPCQGSVWQRGFLLIAAFISSTIPSSAIALPSLWIGLLLLAMLGNFRSSGASEIAKPLLGSKNSPTGSLRRKSITT
jgi:hypothetical protein